jgi:GNAT superfamily N-acetyltransferase
MSIAKLTNRLSTLVNGMKVVWFDGWHPELDDALHDLPEPDNCPHELTRLLIQNPGPVKKRAALVTDGGIPVAVVGLRQRGRYSWELLTQWIIPGLVFPAKPEFIIPALEAIGRDVWVAWWRMAEPPSQSSLIRYLESTPTYRMHFSEDFEQYWRDNRYFKTIRRVRNRCRNYNLKVNFPGSEEWIIKKWEARWRKEFAVMDPSLPDRIVAAKYLAGYNLYFSLTLFDEEAPIGGATMTVQGNHLVAGVLYREPQYHRDGVGDRLIDLSFSFAAEHGFECFDIGGGHKYKKNWARQEGEHWLFNICPASLYRMKQMTRWARKLMGKNGVDLGLRNRIG